MESTDVSDAAQITAAPTITEQSNFGGAPQFFVQKIQFSSNGLNLPV